MTLRPRDPLVGQTLNDRYQIVQRVARGGMATVFEATDLRLARTVAVKIMHADLDFSDATVCGFDVEARMAALLSHPNVVAVFDQGRDGERPYIVMEYVRGRTLRHLLTLESPFEPARALQLLEPVVAALAHAHASGLVHRDVKPENVLISERGQVKVADFGLAHDVSKASVAQGGVVVGTVSYIAPELVSRGHASTRSDVYSLGIMLYELLTGEKPHKGSTPIEVAYAHVHRNVPAPSASGRTAGTIPAYLDALVATATARCQSARQEDAQVLLRQVQAARRALTQGAPSEATLVRVMRATTLQQVDHLLAGRAVIAGGGPRSAGPHPLGTAHGHRGDTAPPPLSPRREVRMTPSNTPSPTFDVHADGPPYSADASGPISPYSPPKPRVAAAPPRMAPAAAHRRRRLLTTVAAVALVAAVSVGTWSATAGRLPATPHVVGLEQSEAHDALATAGLAVQFAREYSETVPAGRVTRSDPEVGVRLEPGSIVLVYLSQGPELHLVPDLKGKSRDEALRLLAGAELGAGAMTEQYDKGPLGSVISQSPAAGSPLRAGSAVDFVVSEGLEPVTVTDLTGKPSEVATKELTDAGFHVKVTYDYSTTVARGGVVSQSPAPGQLRKGDLITLVASRGPRMVTVPDVRKLDVAAAVQGLEAAGFQVATAPVPSPASTPGLVIRTAPSPGTKAAQGSEVTLYVG